MRIARNKSLKGEIMARFIPAEERVMRAIFDIRPNSEFRVALTYDSLFWLDNTQTKPTEKEFNDALTAFDAQEYARNRQDDYPDWGTQLEKIYDDGLTKWKSEMVDPVKTKWPKDNSGPV
jgi:hypothetical protein